MLDKFILYTAPNCPYCIKLKKDLKNRQDAGEIGEVEIREIQDKSDRQVLYAKWGLKDNEATMPQLFIINPNNNERVGSCEESLEWLETMYS